MHSRLILGASLVASLLALPAQGSPAREGWALSAGAFNFQGGDQLELGVEYRFDRIKLFTLPDFRPMVGISATPEGNVWVYGGLGYDIALSERWRAVPNFSIAAYENGGGFDLGGVLEFRSGLEISYRLDGGSRIGLLFYHLSNSRFYDRNPGSETLALVWSLGR